MCIRDSKSGKLFVSKTDYGYFVHALLNPGEENSGKLVSEVKMKAKEIAEKEAISFDYLEKIVSKLEKAGIVQSKRGKNGGSCL